MKMGEEEDFLVGLLWGALLTLGLAWALAGCAAISLAWRASPMDCRDEFGVPISCRGEGAIVKEKMK